MGLKFYWLWVRIRFAYALATLGAWLRAPLTYYEKRVEARREHERELLRLQLEAQHGLMGSMTEMMRDTLKAVTATTAQQQELFKEFLDSFQVHEIPTSTVMRDEDEYRLALEREAEALAKAGVPVSITPHGTVEWMTEHLHANPELALSMQGIDVERLKSALQH